ncbi:hypothetical protein CAPTEDRAFT_187601 [Capitella teleta]|uniref:Uncharacterized protein n=1 Tax=Capitella teleta TaxID=283909 RepID=R7UK19_CAPTE|nr:hypothetical protein CAPTEDRAFT_187601 [Capitella teleta]|eukprot:ELU04143.1 hypothetical protein CAPTEDRAFT_187601 [Capitella teleta]
MPNIFRRGSRRDSTNSNNENGTGHIAPDADKEKKVDERKPEKSKKDDGQSDQKDNISSIRDDPATESELKTVIDEDYDKDGDGQENSATSETSATGGIADTVGAESEATETRKENYPKQEYHRELDSLEQAAIREAAAAKEIAPRRKRSGPKGGPEGATARAAAKWRTKTLTARAKKKATAISTVGPPGKGETGQQETLETKEGIDVQTHGNETEGNQPKKDLAEEENYPEQEYRREFASLRQTSIREAAAAKAIALWRKKSGPKGGAEGATARAAAKWRVRTLTTKAKREVSAICTMESQYSPQEEYRRETIALKQDSETSTMEATEDGTFPKNDLTKNDCDSGLESFSGYDSSSLEVIDCSSRVGDATNFVAGPTISALQQYVRPLSPCLTSEDVPANLAAALQSNAGSQNYLTSVQHKSDVIANTSSEEKDAHQDTQPIDVPLTKENYQTVVILDGKDEHFCKAAFAEPTTSARGQNATRQHSTCEFPTFGGATNFITASTAGTLDQILIREDFPTEMQTLGEFDATVNSFLEIGKVNQDNKKIEASMMIEKSQTIVILGGNDEHMCKAAVANPKTQVLQQKLSHSYSYEIPTSGEANDLVAEPTITALRQNANRQRSSLKSPTAEDNSLFAGPANTSQPGIQNFGPTTRVPQQIVSQESSCKIQTFGEANNSDAASTTESPQNNMIRQHSPTQVQTLGESHATKNSCLEGYINHQAGKPMEASKSQTIVILGGKNEPLCKETDANLKTEVLQYNASLCYTCKMQTSEELQEANNIVAKRSTSTLPRDVIRQRAQCEISTPREANNLVTGPTTSTLGHDVIKQRAQCKIPTSGKANNLVTGPTTSTLRHDVIKQRDQCEIPTPGKANNLVTGPTTSTLRHDVIKQRAQCEIPTPGKANNLVTGPTTSTLRHDVIKQRAQCEIPTPGETNNLVKPSKHRTLQHNVIKQRFQTDLQTLGYSDVTANSSLGRAKITQDTRQIEVDPTTKEKSQTIVILNGKEENVCKGARKLYPY